MTEFGIAIKKRDAFAKYIFNKVWEPWFREVDTVSVSSDCYITVLFNKREGEEKSTIVDYDGFLRLADIRESDFYVSSEPS